MKVTAQYAEEHFADILHAADSGEEVEIARPDRPSYRLELVKPATKQASRRPRRELWGAGEGMLTLPSDEDWKAMDDAFAADLLDRPLFPVNQP